MTTRAAPTTPKSAGERSRVSRTSTRILSRAIAPLPYAVQTIPLTVRWVRLGGLPVTRRCRLGGGQVGPHFAPGPFESETQEPPRSAEFVPPRESGADLVAKKRKAMYSGCLLDAPRQHSPIDRRPCESRFWHTASRRRSGSSLPPIRLLFLAESVIGHASGRREPV